jgi:hypothetical protein
MQGVTICRRGGTARPLRVVTGIVGKASSAAADDRVLTITRSDASKSCSVKLGEDTRQYLLRSSQVRFRL